MLVGLEEQLVLEDDLAPHALIRGWAFAALMTPNCEMDLDHIRRLEVDVD